MALALRARRPLSGHDGGPVGLHNKALLRSSARGSYFLSRGRAPTLLECRRGRSALVRRSPQNADPLGEHPSLFHWGIP